MTLYKKAVDYDMCYTRMDCEKILQKEGCKVNQQQARNSYK